MQNGRRLAIAVFLMLMTSVSTAVAVSTTSHEASTVFELHVPPPHIGDVGKYVRLETVHGGPPEGTEILFGWMEGKAMPDQEGRIIETDRLDITQGNLSRSIWFPRGSTEPLLMDLKNNSQPVPPNLVEAAMFPHTFDSDFDWVSFCPSVVGDEADLLSNLLHPLSNRTIRSDSKLMWPTFGYKGCGPRLNMTDAYRFTGLESIGGVTSMRWEDQRHLVPNRLWFAPGIPYPIRFDGFPCGCTMELVGFTPGSTPRGPSELATQPPALEFKPRTAWGLDETGVVHPFPASKAYRLATEQSEPFRTFLASHPEHYTSSSTFHELRSDGASTLSWFIKVTDGIEFISFLVNETWPDLQVINGRAPGSTPSYSFELIAEGAERKDRTIPRKAELPLLLPTALSLEQRWQVYFPENATNGWGVEVQHCPNKDCDKSSLVTVGRHYRDDRQNYLDPAAGRIPVLYFDQVGVWHGLYLNSSGTAVGFIRVKSELHTWTIDDAQKAITPPNASPRAATPQSLVVNHGWSPTPAEAATLSLFGLLAGALYYFWPALKTSAVGLFSRVRPDRVRDHPQRRRILDVIEADPGIHFSELRRRTDLANGTLLHHLKQLLVAGAVAERPSGGFTCYFAGTPLREQVDSAAALKSEGARRILAAIRAQPGLSNLALAQASGLAPSSVNAHVHRLAAAGLVLVERDGRQVRLRAAAC